MFWLWHSGIVALNTLGITLGLAAIRPSLALAPPVQIPSTSALPLAPAQSLQQLYDIRDRLQAEFTQVSKKARNATNLGTIAAAPRRSELKQALGTTDLRIQIEKNAASNLGQALSLAGNIPLLEPTDNSIEQLETIQASWQQAIDLLTDIPQDAFVAELAREKLDEYKPQLDFVSYQVDTAKSGFLEAIAERTGKPANVRITVCDLAGECRRYRGNQRPADPASLIKVPVAVALMHKVTTENIDIDEPIKISRGNYTEDASDIWVGQKYPLRKVLQRMINQSSNIATNQLIEYMGSKYINQVLRDRGYSATIVKTKLIGNRIRPKNQGSPPNYITTDELTDMMMQIYNFKHPGDDVLVDALVSQEDLKLGFLALKGKDIHWIGEKTGQNSKMLGTTVGAKIGDQRYVMTVTLNHTGSERRLRQVIKDVAEHIRQHGL
ncbi:MAG: serine hydrolase [Cyanothece sp. SIO1E1]|nr:serine hydrolase [Cyanothece sp. SIO1E1]